MYQASRSPTRINFHHSCPILTKSGIYQQILVRLDCAKFIWNTVSMSRVITCGYTDGQTRWNRYVHICRARCECTRNSWIIFGSVYQKKKTNKNKTADSLMRNVGRLRKHCLESQFHVETWPMLTQLCDRCRIHW